VKNVSVEETQQMSHIEEEEDDVTTEEDEDFEETQAETTETSEVAVAQPKKELQVKTDTEKLETFKFTLSYEQRSALEKLLTSMKTMSMDEATFEWNGNLHLRQMDPSRVAAIDATVDTGLGISALANEQPLTKRKFTVNIDQFLRAVKKLHGATIEVADKVTFTMGRTRLTMPVLNDPEPTPDVAKSLDGKLGISTTLEYDKIRKCILLFSNEPDHVTLTAKEGKLWINAENDFQSMEDQIEDAKGEGHAIYNMACLEALKGYYKWTILFGDNMPLKASTIETDTVYVGVGKDRRPEQRTVALVSIFIAPRIESD